MSDVTRQSFKLHLPGLLKVLAEHLYSNKQVAIRELIQNAHDSCLRPTLIDKGRTIDEFRCRLELCRLLSVLGQPLAADVAAARAVAGRLIDPAPLLAQSAEFEAR